MVTLLYIPTFEAYREALSQLGPDFHGEHQAEMLRSTQRFDETLLDGGAVRFMDHDKLVWFNFETDSTSVALGFEKLLKNHWTVGAGIASENNQSMGYDGC